MCLDLELLCNMSMCNVSPLSLKIVGASYIAPALAALS